MEEQIRLLEKANEQLKSQSDVQGELIRAQSVQPRIQSRELGEIYAGVSNRDSRKP